MSVCSRAALSLTGRSPGTDRASRGPRGAWGDRRFSEEPSGRGTERRGEATSSGAHPPVSRKAFTPSRRTGKPRLTFEGGRSGGQMPTEVSESTTAYAAKLFRRTATASPCRGAERRSKIGVAVAMPMNTAEHYRLKAAECDRKAEECRDAGIAERYRLAAAQWRRLAELVEMRFPPSRTEPSLSQKETGPLSPRPAYRPARRSMTLKLRHVCP